MHVRISLDKLESAYGQWTNTETPTKSSEVL